MSCTIEQAAEQHYESLHEALDVVAREKRFLAATQAPALDQSIAFYKSLAAARLPHLVTLEAGRVVGWADVSPLFGESRAHIGVVGIALLPGARHRGLGAKLLEALIEQSWQRGLTRLELSVRTDNTNARMLYERFGFEREGLLRRASCIDGAYQDLYAMALLR